MLRLGPGHPDDPHLHVRAAQARRAYADLNRERGTNEDLPVETRRRALDDATATYTLILATLGRFPENATDSQSAHMGAAGTKSSSPEDEVRTLMAECAAARKDLRKAK